VTARISRPTHERPSHAVETSPSTVVSNKERLLDSVWRLAARARNTAKRHGLLGGAERLLLRIGPLLVRPPKAAVDITLLDGLRLNVPAGYPSARTLRAGIYEPEVSRLIRDSLSDGMTFLDLGANVGYYTLIASRLVGPTGTVYAFEPDPEVFKQLICNVEANGCSNVVAIAKAASDKSGKKGFVRDPYGAEGFLADSGSQPLSIDAIALDDFFGACGWPKIEVIKLDIEGSESAALDGMRGLLSRNHNVQLIMEYNIHALQRAGSSREVLATLLQGYGYSRGFIIEKGMEPFALSGGLPATHATYNLLFQQDAS
jgi:FkbM family methyltransferase